ncbi:MAG: hypothetical protein QM756_37485 [Polyangiaceae bacterium]
MSGSNQIVLQRRGELQPPFNYPQQASPQWEKLWLALRRERWRTLALVPAGKGSTPDLSLEVASQLIRVGSMHLGMRLRIADATQVKIFELNQFMAEVEAVVREDDMISIALAPLQENSTTVAVAQAADAAVLCVALDEVSSQDAKRSISEIGKEKFLGSVAFKTR